MYFRPLIPALLWALFILVICGIPGEKLPRVDFLEWLKPDKLIHLFVFGLLSYLFVKGFLKQEGIAFLKSYPRIFSVLISILYGVLIEVLQSTVFVNRSGDARDVLADALGALIGIWCFNLVIKKRLRRDSSS